MQLVPQFFETNRLVISFIYPMIFFLMGFGILLKNKAHSRFFLSKSLHFMGLFGIVHSFADWGFLFIPLQTTYLSHSTIDILEYLQTILKVLSFSILLHFGTHLMQQSLNLNRKILFLVPGVFSLWLICFTLLKPIFFSTQSIDEWIAYGDAWGNYLIAIPSGILSSYAIYLQKKQFQAFKVEFVNRSLIWITIALNFYTFLAACVFPSDSFSPGSAYEMRFFINGMSLPIESLRAISGIAISILILRILKVVDIEYQQFFYQAERNKVLMEERNRIARDLHDGMIQSIYATGLHVEGIRYQFRHNNLNSIEQTLNILQQVTQKLNGLMVEIRRYINELTIPLDKASNLKDEIENLVQNINQSKELHIDFQYLYHGDEPPLSVTIQIFYIIKEALSNILKHSHATMATIVVSESETACVIEIQDNGQGFQKNESVLASNQLGSVKLGLQNMKQRANSIGGLLTIDSLEGIGTTVRLQLDLNQLKG